MKPTRSILNALLPALLLALAATGCDRPVTGPTAPPAADPADSVAGRLTFAPAAPASEAAALTLPAEVTLPAGARVALGPPMEGRINRWRVSLGDSVAVGDPLADLVTPSLAGFESQEKELEQVVKGRARVLRQRERDVRDGYLTADVVQDARLALEEARAQLARLKAERLDQAALMHSAEEGVGSGDPPAFDGGRWVWRAGTAGVVESIACTAGSVQPPAASCLKLLDPARAELRIAIPESRLGELGESFTVVWHPTAAPDRAVTLVPSRRAPVVEPQSRTRDHYLTPRDAADRDLLVAGATGRATIMSSAPTGTVQVPRSAVTDFEGRTVIFVRGDGPLPTPVEVEVRGRTGDALLVHGEGIAAGVEVATRGVFLLKSHLLLGGE